MYVCMYVCMYAHVSIYLFIIHMYMHIDSYACTCVHNNVCKFAIYYTYFCNAGDSNDVRMVKRNQTMLLDRLSGLLYIYL